MQDAAEIKRWPEQRVADEKEEKKGGKKRGQKGLLSTEAVVFDLERSADLARCVFYCLIIIAALLPARIYWSRQAGSLSAKCL